MEEISTSACREFLGIIGSTGPSPDIYKRPTAPNIDLGATKDGVGAVFNLAVNTAKPHAFEELLGPLQLDTRLKRRLPEAIESLSGINKVMAQEYKLADLPGPDELDEEAIQEGKERISTCELITESQSEIHLAELTTLTEKEQEKWREEHNRAARNNMARQWESDAYAVLQAGEQQAASKQSSWPDRLRYLLFQRGADELIAAMSPPDSMAARTRAGVDGLMDSMLGVYDSMACHADAERLARLCGAGGQPKEQCNAGDGPQPVVWKDATRSLAAAIANGKGQVFQVKFPGHSMCLVHLGATVDVYESIAGAGPGKCMLKALCAGKATRSLKLEEIDRGLQGAVEKADIGSEDDEYFARSIHFEIAFGVGNLPAPKGEWQLTWQTWPLLSPDGIVDRLCEEYEKGMALIDALSRMPIPAGDSFHVLSTETHWVVSVFPAGTPIALAEIKPGPIYAFELRHSADKSGGDQPKAKPQRVLGKVKDVMPPASERGPAIAVITVVDQNAAMESQPESGRKPVFDTAQLLSAARLIQAGFDQRTFLEIARLSENPETHFLGKELLNADGFTYVIVEEIYGGETGLLPRDRRYRLTLKSV